MTTASHIHVPDRSILAWTGGIVAIWLIAAVLRPDTTLHLGPLLVPLVPAVLGRDAEHPLRLTLLGIGGGIVTILILLATGNLNGPALNPFPNALTESIVLLGVGGGIGIVVTASAGQRSL